MTSLLLLSSSLVFLTVLTASGSIGPLWDRYSQQYVGDLIESMRSLGTDDKRINAYMRWWGICMVAAPFILGVLFRMVPLALGAAYLVFVAPRYVLGWQISRRRSLLSRQMVRASVAMANSARAGLSLAQGLDVVASDAAEPLKSEFQRMTHEYKAGRPLGDTLSRAQNRFKLAAFTVFSTVVLVCMERGGNIAFALERISENLEEMQRLQGKLEATTASGRRMALFLGCFPIVFLIGFTVLDPAMMNRMYTTTAGQLILLGVGALVYVSVRWCIHILNIDF